MTYNRKLKFKQILYISFDGDGPMFEWPKHHFVDELRRYNIKVHQLAFRRNEEIVSFTTFLKKIIKEQKIDLILCGLDDSVVKDELADYVKTVSIPTVLMCQDNLSVPFKHKHTCKLFDLVWLLSTETEYLFKKWGANTCYLPYAANPFIFRPSGDDEHFDYDVTFIGTLYGARKTVLQNLQNNSVKLKVYGKDTSNYTPVKNLNRNPSEKIKTAFELTKFKIGRRALTAALKKSVIRDETNLFTKIELSNQLPFEKLPEIYSQSKLSLGSFELWSTYVLKSPVYKLHLRTFEVPMSGGLQLANNIPELHSLYENKKEILMYNSIDELIDLVKFYASGKRDTLRKEMKRNARLRSESEHSWIRRFESLSEKI